MKKLFKYEINESVAAKAALNCVHKRLFKEFYLGHPTPQEEVMSGDYDPDEWENDSYGNAAKRELVIQALVQANLIQSEEEGLPLNNKIQQIMDKTGFTVSNAQDAMKFVKAYGQQIVGQPQEQEESTGDDKYAIAKQVMANYNPDTDEYEDPMVWLRYAIQDHIGKQFLYLPKKEVKAWQQAIEETVNEYDFENQQEEHPEDYDSLQSQLADAWDEGMADDEDDYVPYENKFDETHRDLVDNLLSAVQHYFDTEDDVNGFYHYYYTEDQIGKAIEQILDKYGDFPSSNNFNKCYAWAEEHAEEIMKILETGSLENSYEGHPEFDFSEQEEEYDDPYSMASIQRHDMMQEVTQCMAEVLEERGIDVGGDLDEIYFIISDIIERTGDVPQKVEDGGYYPWCEEYVFDVEDLL